MTDQTENTQQDNTGTKGESSRNVMLESRSHRDEASQGGAAESNASESSVEQLKARLEAEKQARAAAEAEILKHEAAVVQINNLAGEVKKSLADAVGAYKSLLISSNPSVPPEMITGNSIREIDASLESARNLVSRVRLAVEAEISAGRVPAGAPPRSAPDTEGLTSREKIQYGLAKGGRG